MAKAKPAEEYEDIPGTFVFNAERSRQGYGINMFCMSLMKEENRKAFKANEAEYLKKFKLTPKQIKTLVTRAGPGTKIICLGNIAQIDTPYLTEGSSGLTYVVDRFKGWAHSGHVTLARGERSRLADFASEVL